MEESNQSSVAKALLDPAVKDCIDDHLSLSLIRDEAKNELLEILESVRGRKYLVVDTNLSNLLMYFVTEGSKFFKDNGINYCKELTGDVNEFVSETGKDVPENIIYLVRPHLPNMKLIAQQIKVLVQNGLKCQFRIYFVPNQSTVCMHLLEEQISNAEVWERITFKEFKMGLIPMDSDLLSLEMDYVFKQV